MGRRIGGFLLAAILTAGGCAPKRVTSTGVVAAPAARERRADSSAAAGATAPSSAAPVAGRREASASAEPGPPLPPPEPIARAGRHTLAGQRPGAAGSGAKSAELGRRAVDLARAQLGKPYQWGAAGPDRFDCSGLVQYVYSNLGVPLPRVSSQQAGAGVHVDRKDLAPGDLVFFRLNGSRIDHVGIYVGQDRFIHAPNRHEPVQIDSLNDSWWRRKFKGGRRVG